MNTNNWAICGRNANRKSFTQQQTVMQCAIAGENDKNRDGNRWEICAALHARSSSMSCKIGMENVMDAGWMNYESYRIADRILSTSLYRSAKISISTDCLIPFNSPFTIYVPCAFIRAFRHSPQSSPQQHARAKYCRHFLIAREHAHFER